MPVSLVGTTKAGSRYDLCNRLDAKHQNIQYFLYIHGLCGNVDSPRFSINVGKTKKTILLYMVHAYAQAISIQSLLMTKKIN